MNHESEIVKQESWIENRESILENLNPKVEGVGVLVRGGEFHESDGILMRRPPLRETSGSLAREAERFLQALAERFESCQSDRVMDLSIRRRDEE